MHFYWAIINWNFIWNIDLSNGVYCDVRNKSACLNTALDEDISILLSALLCIFVSTWTHTMATLSEQTKEGSWKHDRWSTKSSKGWHILQCIIEALLILIPLQPESKECVRVFASFYLINTITNYIIIIYERSNFDDVLDIVSQSLWWESKPWPSRY